MNLIDKVLTIKAKQINKCHIVLLVLSPGLYQKTKSSTFFLPAPVKSLTGEVVVFEDCLMGNSPIFLSF